MNNSCKTIDPIVNRLRNSALDLPEMPDLRRTIGLYESILPLVRDADLHQVPVSVTPEQVRAKMKRGEPLLVDLDLELDMQEVQGFMIRLACALENSGCNEQDGGDPSRGIAARRIRLFLEDHKLDISCLISCLSSGDRDFIQSVAGDSQLDSGLLFTLLQYALNPALMAWCRQLTPLAAGTEWDRGYCFICGAGALLGELRDDNKSKHLRCGRCGADWRVNRLQCVHCGNGDHKTLGYLYAENRKVKERVEVCNKCKGYLKVITSFAPTPPEMLSAEDMATLYLDYIATDRGYFREAERHPDSKAGGF